MLAQEPQVLHRLRQEVLDQVGGSRRPTLDDFKYMKYMRAVINGRYNFLFRAELVSLVCRDVTALPHRVSLVPIYGPVVG